MALQHSGADLQKAVRNIPQFSSLYSDSESMGWNSQAMEFKPFLHSNRQSQTLDNFYFKLFKTDSSMKYVKEKYKKLFKDFQGCFVNVEVQLVSQKLHDCVYLIRGTENYFSLERLIENSERKILSISFILRLLEFFNEILRIVEKQKLKIDLTASTILEKDGVFKLADYKLLFHPNNLKTNDANLRQDLTTQMKYVVFDVLSLKNRDNRENFMADSLTLVKQLKERRSESTSKFIQIIDEFLNDGVVSPEEISRSRNNLNATVDDVGLLERTLTSSDISIPLLHRQDSSMSETEISQSKPALNRKKLWRIMFFVLVIVIIASLGITYYFLTRDIDCGKFHYQENRKCYSCPDSCYSCVGGGEYNCTYCIASYWLVLKDSSDHTGKCSVECMGFKDMSTMHCLPLSTH